ncbi:MAG: glutamate-5-semialdehyde dehydrogenase [Spirochaetaceae bacterium]|jgi:glutamate-5-semialdehyde dehydrogenase|nr:glutamate-5-semialdehyde dehydrogenase [Spirochaetaceae bacterium]
MQDFTFVCADLRNGARALSLCTAAQKNKALAGVAGALALCKDAVLNANARDVERSRKAGAAESLVDRLALTPARYDGMIEALHTVIRRRDPIGEEITGWRLANGVRVRQVRVPLGVAAVIYESRPAVTVDAFALAYKSGNAILLRGSSAALESNRALAAAILQGLRDSPDGIESAFALLDSGERSEVERILNAAGLIDVVLPRGGADLIRMVMKTAKIPVIETGSGVCHVFVDQSACIDAAVSIVENAKLQRPGVCNAIETVVVHRAVMEEFLNALVRRFAGRAELRCDAESYELLKGSGRVVRAAESDFGFEFLDEILAVKIVGGFDEAVDFINAHTTKHSDCIVTRNLENAEKFQMRIDAACVYVNASTRFTDGGEFGFGAELGISTQKLHVRGPMGLTALTTTKYYINGEGQIR